MKLTIIFVRSFLDAVPTAELEPITETYVQSDEVRNFIASTVYILVLMCLIYYHLG